MICNVAGVVGCYGPCLGAIIEDSLLLTILQAQFSRYVGS